MQTLRPYQFAAVDAVMESIDPFGSALNRVLYTLATGTGKTTIMAELTRRILDDQNGRVLVLAHRTELITQTYQRIQEHCNLHEWEIGTEIAAYRANAACRVIVGSVQTCMRVGRPVEGWTPTAIITDEAHHSPATSYRKIVERYGVLDGKCIHIGCTATAKRTDRLSLYARKLDGSPVMLERRNTAPKPASLTESVYERHVYDYGVLPAVEDGWLVPLKGEMVRTQTDINDVKTVAGDFVEGQLAKAVDNETRTLLAISAWKQKAADRPTLVFCASVEHAHNAANLWRQAGYSAEAVDGKTENFARGRMFRDFQRGKLQVLCNMGIATEGTDLPTCACIVHLRPTKSWNLYVQMSGRGTRALPGVLDGLEEKDAAVRLAAIAESAKPDCIVLDLVDLYEKCGDLCSVPSILDLPVKLDLQGHSVTDAKRLLDEFAEVKDRVIGECPTTYQELKVRLEAVNLMRHSQARSVQDWRATDSGYRYTKVPPGYQVEIHPTGPVGEESFRLLVQTAGTAILDKTGKKGREMKAYLDSAANHAREAIETHRESQPKPSRGTLHRLTEKQVRVLTRNGHTRHEIDTWPYARAKGTIDKLMREYHASIGTQT